MYDYPKLKAGDQDWRWCHRYAHDVVNEIIPAGRWIRLACERHLADLERDDIRFDEVAAKSIVKWFSYVPITDGKNAGKPTVLLPWQIFVVVSLIAWKWSETTYDADGNELTSRGLRRYNQAFVLVARKGGKTTLAAGLMLYLMYKSGFQPRAVSLATKKDQAKLLWSSAKMMIKLSPQLSAIFEPRANDILLPNKAGEFKALASDSNSLDGLNPITASLDECFIEGTKIGSIPIEKVQTGDVVNTYCEKTGEIKKGVVGKLYKNHKEGLIYTITTSKSEITCTGNHPIYTDKGWVNAQSVEVGDLLTLVSGDGDRVVKVESQHFSGYVYNFEVLGTHTYFANGLLVHNCHAVTDRNLYGVIVSAFGAQPEYLMITITTAGFVLDGICTDLYKNGCRTLSPDDAVNQDNYFYAIFQAEAGDQWDDPQVWYKSNPGLIYGLPSMKYLKDRCQEAQMSSEEKGNFLTKHLNLFVAGADKWLNLDDVKACREPLDMSDYVLDKAYGFIDRSEVLDITTIGAIVPTPDGGCAAFFLNLMGTRGMESANDYLQGVYRKAIDEGDMVLLPSPTIDDVHVKEHSIEFFSQWKDVEMIGFDPWHMRQAADELTALNHPMVEVRQSTGNMSEPAKKLESLIINKLFKYDSRLFEYACSCALMGVTRQGNVVIFKESGSKTDKIDPLVGAIIGLSCATLQKVETHVYEERGLLML